MGTAAEASKATQVVPPDHVDAAWMTRQLRQAGVLGDSAVVALSSVPVGNGMVGTSLRYALTYDTREPDAPDSVVGKFPATDATSRRSGAGMQLYLRETSFYRHIAPTVSIRTPRVLANHFDPATHDFVLLFEDLSPARGGDQLCGCSVEDAHVAMLEIAALHGPRWNDPMLRSMSWLGLPDNVANGIVGMLPAAVDMFRERYGAVVEPDVLRAAERMATMGHAIMFNTPAETTVLHGDFRLDNVLYDAGAGAWPMATLDWQTVTTGCGTQDVAYFLGAGLRAWDRAAHETDLVRMYHQSLQQFGVTGYSWDQCWADYCKHSVNGLFMAVLSAISVTRTDRGDDMFLTMARRHAAQSLELKAFDYW